MSVTSSPVSLSKIFTTPSTLRATRPMVATGWLRGTGVSPENFRRAASIAKANCLRCPGLVTPSSRRLLSSSLSSATPLILCFLNEPVYSSIWMVFNHSTTSPTRQSDPSSSSSMPSAPFFFFFFIDALAAFSLALRSFSSFFWSALAGSGCDSASCTGRSPVDTSL